MKITLKLIFSAILGSLLTWGVVMFTDKFNGETNTVSTIDHMPVHGVVYTKNDSGDLVPLDFTVTAEKVMPSVVHIRSTVSETAQAFKYRQLPDPFRDFFGEDWFDRFYGPNRGQPREFKRQGTGSGVIINENGYIVTNNHVINQAEEIEVTLYNNESYQASVVGIDPETDLALIKIDANNLQPLALVNSDDVKVGEWVMAVGNPFNLNSTVTAGIVSAKGRNINILRDRYAIESFIQTDAAINPGNSGGALVNLEGGLIGINTAIASPTGSYAGYGFAVPSNMVNKIVEDLLKYGAVQRGFLGVTIRSVNSKLAEEEDLEVGQGVYIDSVSANSSAEEAGIKPGDVILEVDNIKVESSPELQELIATHRPGDKLSIKVDRFGKEKTFNVVLKNRQGTNDIKTKEYTTTLMNLGADFQPLTKKEAEKLGIDGGIKIAKLYPGKLKRDTGVREGFIITKIDRKPVKTMKDLTEALEGKRGGLLMEGFYEDVPGTQYYGFGLD